MFSQAVLLRLLREAVDRDESLERDVAEEDLVVPEWRREARELLDEIDRLVPSPACAVEPPIDALVVSAYIRARPAGQRSVGSASASRPAPRERGALALCDEIPNLHYRGPAPTVAALLEAPSSSCQCGCGATAPVATKTDRRYGAIAGQPRRFIKGHAARLRPRLEFEDVTADWFWSQVDRGEGTGCWQFPKIQLSVGGRRVYALHVALLLHRGLPVTPKALAKLQVRGRCRRHRCCVRPDHMCIRSESPDILRRAEAMEAARARLPALRAAPATTKRRTSPDETVRRDRK